MKDLTEKSLEEAIIEINKYAKDQGKVIAVDFRAPRRPKIEPSTPPALVPLIVAGLAGAAAAYLIADLFEL